MSVLGSDVVKMYRVVCLLVLVSKTHQVTLGGECNNAAIGGYVTDLNITRMFGTWYQIARIDNGVEVGECSSLTLQGTYDSSGNLASVEATHTEFINGTKTTRNGFLLSLDGVGVDGVYTLNLTDILVERFVVQATNYTGFAVLYSCTTISSTSKSVLAWQYHRTASLSSAEDDSVKEVINNNPDLRNVNWIKPKHDDKSCGKNAGVSITLSKVLIVVAAILISKEYI